MRLRWIGLGLTAILLAGLGALAWRLDRGPITLPFVAERIEAAFNSGTGPRIEVGGAHLAWRFWRDGSITLPEILLTRVRALRQDGTAFLELPDTLVTLAPGALLHGRIAPRRLELGDPLLRARRKADGGIDLGLGTPLGRPVTASAGPPGEGVVQRLVRALLRPPATSPLASIETLAIRSGRLVIDDQQLGREWTVRELSLTVSRESDRTMEGDASGELLFHDQIVPVSLAASLAGEPRRLQFDLSLPRIHPGALARAAPPLAPLGVLDAPSAISVKANLAEDGSPSAVSLALEAGPGRLDWPEAGAIPFLALHVALAGTPQALELEQLALRLAPAPQPDAPPLPGPKLTAEGAARLEAGRWLTEARLTLDQAPLHSLETWWPRNLAPAARGWVAENLIAGALRNGAWDVAISFPASLDAIEVIALSGEAILDDIGVRWLPGVPPLEGLSGLVTFAPEAATLHATGARQAGTALLLPEARLRLTGLGAGPTQAELRGRVTGPVSDLWVLLNDPQLGLLADRNLPMDKPTGTLDAEVTATIPLAGPTAAADPIFHVAATLSELRLPELVLGRTLQEGEFDVIVERTGLRADGRGSLGGIPTRAKLRLNFPSAPAAGVGVAVTATARIPSASLSALGFGTGDILAGPVGILVKYEQRSEEAARLSMEADFEATRITLPILGYAKPAGAKATAAAVLRLREGQLQAVESLQAEAPDLLLRAAATGAAGGPGGLMEIREGRFGETRFTGTVQRPAEPSGTWAVALRGPVIDLRPFLGQVSGEAGAVSQPEPPKERGSLALALDARFERALTPGAAQPLRNLMASGTIVAGTLREARVAAEVGDAASFAASLTPQLGGGRTLRLEAQDTGTVLQALGFLIPLQGGQLDLVATQEPGPFIAPVAGTASLTNFAVRDAPVLGKLLQAITGFGLLEALSGPGLNFAQAKLPFRYGEGTLAIGEARAFSASLGLTTTGQIDFDHRVLDLQGTIVPAYVFNTLLGNLPIVGGLFSPERGGGLFATAFTATGPFSDPNVSVNPLSALTPGFLRKLFDLGGAAVPDEESTPPSPP